MTRQEEGGLRRFLILFASTMTVVLALQTGTLIYWAGKMTVKVEYLDRDQQKLAERVLSLEGR